VVATGKLSEQFTGSDLPTAAELIQHSGLSPLQAGRAGFAAFYQTDDTPSARVDVLLSQYVDETDGGRRLVEGLASYATGGLVTDLAPFSKTSDIFVLVALGNTSAGDAQILCLKASIDDADWPESPSVKPLLTLAEFWSQEYEAAFWLDRPDTCLAAQPMPSVAGGPTQRIVAVMGNWVAPGAHRAVDQPRLMVADIEGVGLWSHEFGYGRAHGMIVNQAGEIYVTGTADIVNGGDFLVCKYDVSRLGETLGRVAHGADGLGGYTGDPADTHVITPMWTGANLIVMDEGPTATYAHVYDRDLRFLKRTLVSETASPGGPRFRGSSKATAWWGQLY
jgi:hypothetical protein